MLKYFLLALLGLAGALPQQYKVEISFDLLELTLHISISDNDVASVVFHYGQTGSHQIGKGYRTADGWTYFGSLPAVDGDAFYAYANITYNNGRHITTQNSTMGFRPVEENTAALSPRRIRSVLFRDDFNSYNTENWQPEVSMFGGYNGEFQVYTPESKNIYAANGNLYLRPTLTTDDPRWDENFLHHGTMDLNQIWGYCTDSGNDGCSREGKYGMLPPVMSGKVSSTPTIRYGTVEVRARIPRGDWLWPAIWMLPEEEVYGDNPRSGEIDIMESIGNAGNLGVGTVSSTLHWGPDEDQNRFMMTTGERHATNFHAAFHTWRLDWTQDYLRTYVDNQLIMDVNVGNGFWAKGGFSGGNIWAGHDRAAPFDQDFFLILNVAVGGTSGFFSDSDNWGTRKPWANDSPTPGQDFWNGRNDWLPSWQGDNTALQVDYVEFRN